MPTQRIPVDDAVRERFVELAVAAAAAAATRVGADDGLVGPTAPAWPGAFGTSQAALDWVVEHQHVLAAAMRAGVDHAPGELAFRLASSLWGLTSAHADLLADPSWRRHLAVWGERAAERWGNDVVVAVLIDRSAQVAMQAKDMLVAEDQWIRAWRAWRRLADEARMLNVMNCLIELFVRWNRLHRALDVALELLDVHQGRGVPVDVARTMARLAQLYVLAGRMDAAAEQFTRAASSFGELPTPHPVEHAAVLVSLGRARWSQTMTSTAQRHFHEALRLVIDVDDHFADQIRVLLQVRPGAELPE